MIEDKGDMSHKALKTPFCIKCSKVGISKQCNVGLLNIVDILQDEEMPEESGVASYDDLTNCLKSATR